MAHKYDKRFTSSGLAYKPRWYARHCWRLDRQVLHHRFRELALEPDEDVWDIALGKLAIKQEFIDYY